MDKLDIPLIECCFEQGVSNFVGDLVKTQILILTVWLGPEVLNFCASFQVLLVLPVCGPHYE